MWNFLNTEDSKNIFLVHPMIFPPGLSKLPASLRNIFKDSSLSQTVITRKRVTKSNFFSIAKEPKAPTSKWISLERFSVARLICSYEISIPQTSPVVIYLNLEATSPEPHPTSITSSLVKYEVNLLIVGKKKYFLYGVSSNWSSVVAYSL